MLFWWIQRNSSKTINHSYRKYGSEQSLVSYIMSVERAINYTLISTLYATPKPDAIKTMYHGQYVCIWSSSSSSSWWSVLNFEIYLGNDKFVTFLRVKINAFNCDILQRIFGTKLLSLPAIIWLNIVIKITIWTEALRQQKSRTASP